MRIVGIWAVGDCDFSNIPELPVEDASEPLGDASPVSPSPHPVRIGIGVSEETKNDCNGDIAADCGMGCRPGAFGGLFFFTTVISEVSEADGWKYWKRVHELAD